MPHSGQSSNSWDHPKMAFAASSSAISVVNAIGTGLGGAIGIAIPCSVTAAFNSKNKGDKKKLLVKSSILDKHNLVPTCVSYVEHFLSAKPPTGSKLALEIESDIPVAFGLKSSSAISTAVVSAVTKLYAGKEIEADTILRLSCNASKASGASITGAYDDAIACLLGGLVLTNNRDFRVFKHTKVPTSLGELAIVRVPLRSKVYTSSVKRESYSSFRKNAKDAFEMGEKGNVMGAMMLNSLIQCSALGYSFEPVMSAILEGASSAGVSGKGPAIAALCATNTVARRIEKRWFDESENGNEIEVIKTRVVQPKKLLKS